MNVNEFKKQCFKWGMIFTVVGGIVTAIGFGLSGFDPDAYHTKKREQRVPHHQLVATRYNELKKPAYAGLFVARATKKK
nr:hypothetical protein [Bacillus pumilus]